MNTEIVSIDLGQRSYDIYIGSSLLKRFDDFVPEDMKNCSVFIVSDENTKAYAQDIAKAVIRSEPTKVEQIVFKAGEQTKSFANYERLCNWLLKKGVQRNSFVIAVGGGVIGDLSGFAAASVLRGVPFVQVPTSLLAQVDSSVGGKTGINSSHGKNLIGAFYQPISVVADLSSLETLPRRELLSGYAEVLKYGLIGDLEFFEWLEDHGHKMIDLDYEALSHAIAISTKMKAKLVEADEKEAGRRALLNLGHTFGHALETAMGYDGRLLHGEAVAIGMVLAFDLSSRLNHCGVDEYERVETHIREIGLPTSISAIGEMLKIGVDDLLDIMRKDKKVKSNKMTFVLVSGIGDAFLTQDVSEKLVRQVITDSMGDESKKGSFKAPRDSFNKGIKGLWKSAFSSLSSQS